MRSLPASDFNAIDPDIIQDNAGTPWLVFGSYWSGVQMVQLQWPSGKRSADPTRTQASGSDSIKFERNNTRKDGSDSEDID